MSGIDDRSADRVIGASSTALIAELQRLQKAFDLQRDNTSRPVARRLTGFSGERRIQPRRKRHGRLVRRVREHLWSASAFLLGRPLEAHGQLNCDAEISTNLNQAFARELRAGLRVLIVSAGILGGCAALIPLSGAVIVPGTLVVESSVKKIQHPAGGVVARIPVHDGMHVQTGELVLQLDQTQAKANYRVLKQQLDQIRAREARLIAERDGRTEPQSPLQLGEQDEEAIKQLWAAELSLFKSSRGSAAQRQRFAARPRRTT